MVWPIIRGESYVGETGKSLEVMDLAVSRKDSCRNIPIILIGSEDTMIEDLFDLIGGRSVIEAATELFYDKVLHDDSLRHFFEGVDVAHLRSRQAMFISMLLGGRVYTGKNIHDAHARSRDHGLNDAHFDLFLKHFRVALEEVGVKPENAEKVMKRLESKRGTVLEPRDCS